VAASIQLCSAEMSVRKTFLHKKYFFIFYKKVYLGGAPPGPMHGNVATQRPLDFEQTVMQFEYRGIETLQ